MRYEFKDLKLRDMTEEEKAQFKENGCIGDEGGDGYVCRTVATFENVYDLPYGNDTYSEIIGATMLQLNVGGVFDNFDKKVVEGLEGCDKDAFFLIDPTIASSGYYCNRVIFDDFVEAIQYYNEIKNFSNTL